MARVTSSNRGAAQRAARQEQAQPSQTKPAGKPTKTGPAAAQAQTRDGVDQAPVPTKPGEVATAGRSTEAASVDGANAFGQLATLAKQGGGAQLRVLAQALGLDVDASPTPEMLGALVDAEASAASLSGKPENLVGKFLKASDSVRQGFMMSLSDGVEKYLAGGKIPRGLVEHLGQEVTKQVKTKEAQLQETKLANVQSAMHASRGHFPMGMDINAFVQAVLRESYLLQNEQLKDFADRVKFFNELKKKTRAKLNFARQALTGDFGEGDVLAEHLAIWNAGRREWVLFGGEDDASVGQGGKRSNYDPFDNDSGASEPLDTGPLEELFARPETEAPTPASRDLIERLQNAYTSGGWAEICRDFYNFVDSDPSASFDSLFNGLENMQVDDMQRLVTAALAAIKYGSGQIPVKDFRKVDQPGGATQYQKLEQYGQDFLDRLMEEIPTPMLRELKEALASHGEWANELDNATGFGLRDRLADRESQLAKLGPPFSDDFQHIGELYLDMVENPNSRSMGLLKKEIHRLGGLDARGVIKALHDHGGLSAGQFAEVLFSADPKVLFDGASEQAQTWLLETVDQYQSQVESDERATINVASILEQRGSLDSHAHVKTVGAGFSSPEGGDNGQIEDSSSAYYDYSIGPFDEELPTFNKERIEQYVKSLEESLSTIGDDAQLANVDLQNALQKQQQTLQMMSNISKMLHDTAMSIIRKIGS